MYERARAGDSSPMNERGCLHRVDEDLAEGAVEEWAASGLLALEAYLAKHAAFLSFLDSRD